MGRFHFPCCIVGVFGGRYQLYCPNSVLNTSFGQTELVPLGSCFPIPLRNWRQATKVSLHSVACEPAVVECCNYCVPISSDSIVISSASEEENEAPELCVDNCAYSLTHVDREVVLSLAGWLTDKIISAAQMILLQFFPNMTGLNLLHCRRCLHLRSTLGTF